MLTLGAVLVSLAFAIPQAIAAQATLQATEGQGKNLAQQQLTERFSKAVEQLGTGDNIEAIGGIYALERIARDSAADQPTVMNVLTTFVREKTERDPQGRCSDQPPTVGVQTALDVLAHRIPRDNDPRIDLSGQCLARVDLKRGDLHYATFEGADLRGANLEGLNLKAAGFDDADLRDARFEGGAYAGVAGDPRYAVPITNLSGASFRDADLTHASFSRAYLRNTFFHRADLTDAYLTNANLLSAFFNSADLTRADFHGTNPAEAANFGGATLTGTGLSCTPAPKRLGKEPGLACDFTG